MDLAKEFLRKRYSAKTFTFPRPSSFLHEEVDMVDFERIELCIWTVDVKEEPAEGDENVNVVSVPFLKSVDLAMAYVVVVVRQSLLTHPYLPPTLGVILASVGVQRERESHL